MPNTGLSKSTIPERVSYSGGSSFTASAGEIIKLEKTGTEYIEYTVPAGESWTVRYDLQVTVE